MRVIGVVDLLGGRAVHARGGARDRYVPVRVSGGVPVDGDAVALARAYIDRCGFRDIYAADLDAIVHGTPQAPLVKALAGLGARVWLDAGVSSVDAARAALDHGASRVIVGLETLTSFDVLARICGALGSERVAFSLDLRDGVPITHIDGARECSPERLAARAMDAGASAIVVIDLRRVGTGGGIDLPTVGRVRRAAPGVALVAGGGVRTIADVDRLADSGCDGVLMATALHDGLITPGELTRFARFPSV